MDGADMSESGGDVKALAEAFEQFTRSTRSLEEAYRLLEQRATELGQELAAKNRELALTNDYLDCILESMSDGVIAIDTQGTITKLNRSASRILGYHADQAVGRPFRELFGRDFVVDAQSDPMKLRAQDGQVVRVVERDSPMSDRTNKRIGYVKVFEDLTEIEALRSRIRQMDRLAAIGEMAASVAHEIRNPLGGIRGFASLLARDIEMDDPRLRLVDKILEGVKNLDGVVNELLEYTRPVDLHVRPTFCAQVVDTAIGYLELGDRPITVTNTVSRDLEVLIDADKMRQVFLNILLNAVESIDVEGEIEVAADTAPNTVTVGISDTGCGMDDEALDNMLSPFFSTKEKGTGLGLAVATKIVEGHGGVLEALSEPGKGSTFFVRLPRTE